MTPNGMSSPKHFGREWSRQPKICLERTRGWPEYCRIETVCTGALQTCMYISHAELTYFDCKDILNALKELDGDARTLFGQYTAPRVKVKSSPYKIRTPESEGKIDLLQ